MEKKRIVKEKNPSDKIRVINVLILYLGTIAMTAGSSFLYRLNENQIIANTVMAGIAGGIFLFALLQELSTNSFHYDNALHFSRFLLIYCSSVVFACVLPLLPSSGWFYPVIAVALAIYSNTIIGMVGSSLLLMISTLLGGASTSIFLLYFMSNMVAIFSFRKLDDDFQVGYPTFITMIMLFIATMAMDILFIQDKLTMEAFMIPIINTFITAALLLLLMKNFSVLVVHKYRNKYMEINDQEYTLMIQLKQKSKVTYYHSIHCAYLCERIARRLELNVPLAKAAGYYQKIGIIQGQNLQDASEDIYREHEFPPDITQLLLEYVNKKKKVTSKEGSILLLADTVVSSLLYLFAKDKNAQLDYDQIISAIFKKKQDGGDLNQSQLTMQELSEVKKIFLEEKLYYDFLR